MFLRVKALPGSAKTEITELLKGEEPTLKIRLAAPPEKGKANLELCKFLGNMFDAQCEVISGKAERVKLVKLFQ